MIIHPGVYTNLASPLLANYLARSAYSLDEIKATLAEAEKAKAEFDALSDRVYKILDPIPWWDRNDKENKLNSILSENACVQPGFGFKEVFPLTQWKKAIASQRTHNRKIEKALKEFEQCQPNP
jgi:predicted cupin superfamily sugar epimerase